MTHASPQTWYSRFLRPRIALVAIGVAVVSIVGLWQVFATSAQQGPTTRIQLDGPQSVGVNEAFDVTLIVHHARNAGGYETTVDFEGPDVRLLGVEHRLSDLHKLSRDLQVLPVISDTGDNGVTSTVTFGAFSCPVEICTEALAQSRQSQGAQGQVRLAHFSVLPLEPGPLTIRLANPLFVDAVGNPVELDIRAAELTVQVTEGD